MFEICFPDAYRTKNPAPQINARFLASIYGASFRSECQGPNARNNHRVRKCWMTASKCYYWKAACWKCKYLLNLTHPYGWAWPTCKSPAARLHALITWCLRVNESAFILLFERILELLPSTHSRLSVRKLCVRFGSCVLDWTAITSYTLLIIRYMFIQCCLYTLR